MVYGLANETKVTNRIVLKFNPFFKFHLSKPQESKYLNIKYKIEIICIIKLHLNGLCIGYMW